MRRNIKDFKATCIKLEFMIFLKCLCLVSMIKKYLIDDGISALAYFHKDIKI